MENQQVSFKIPDSMQGQRLDVALSGLLADYSRSRIQRWIKNGDILVDGCSCRAKHQLLGGESITVSVVTEVETHWLPESLPLQICYEDEDILVVDKPVGLVVHPGAGNPNGTLSNALLAHAPQLVNVPRAGIVHRIDKNTSGLLVVAKNIKAQKSLVDQLQARTVTREYQAVVHGVMTAGGEVNEPIGRHPVHRTRMAVVHSGKPAMTYYRVLQKFHQHTHIRLQLETGRTHQIRVHMAHIRYPLVGDATYGGRFRLPAGCDDELKQTLQSFKRQALHAAKLGINHPDSGEYMSWQAELPADMLTLLERLRLNNGVDKS